jgi:hypothetical protein
MEISFKIAGVPAQFSRSWLTGRAELRAANNVISIASPYRISTHYRFATSCVWEARVDGHDVKISQVRPAILAGVRPHFYTVSVDDTVVAEATGR